MPLTTSSGCSMLVVVGLLLLVGCQNEPATTTAGTATTANEATSTAPTASTATSIPQSETPANSATDTTAQAATSSAEGQASATFYTIGVYDVASKPDENLSQTLRRAEAENKRVLLQVGGEWCGWCKLMEKFMTTNEAIKSHLNQHFVVMKVTYPGDHAEAFLSKYPKIDAYPHLFVLEKTGELLHSQGTGELEQGQGYNEQAFLTFLQQWTR